MSSNHAGTNYAENRCSRFKHNVPDDLILPAAPTVQDYINNERSKQMSKLRDWHLESKDSQTDLLRVRSNFSNMRSFEAPIAMQDLDQKKGYFMVAALLAGIIGGILLFGHS